MPIVDFIIEERVKLEKPLAAAREIKSEITWDKSCQVIRTSCPSTSVTFYVHRKSEKHSFLTIVCVFKGVRRIRFITALESKAEWLIEEVDSIE